MSARLAPQDAAFRDEVRQFLAEHLPVEAATRIREGHVPRRQDVVDWHRTLAAQGWAAGHWPRQWGGADWTPLQRYLFNYECAKVYTPPIASFGINMLGPVLIRYGTDAQRSHLLPRILNCDDWWCQGYSEPGAGSDLAALRMSARREGDHFVLNGQKTWTTDAHHANMIFCLVRTDPSAARKQEGISFLLIDLAAPGVERRPIRLIEGGCEVSEVFFTDVYVPAGNLVGEENRGWDCAKYLLTYERTSIAGTGPAAAALERLQQMASAAAPSGIALRDNPLFAQRLARIEIALANLETTSLRVLSRAGAVGAAPADISMLKIKNTQIQQEIDALLLVAAGPRARILITDESGRAIGPAATYFNDRKLSIYGGSNEIQKTIAAKAILEL